MIATGCVTVVATQKLQFHQGTKTVLEFEKIIKITL
jgi:hypothetical protein